MSDLVNDFFRQHYPADAATAWESDWCAGGVSRRYRGEAGSGSAIFPKIVCSDGFSLSVQGHFGAYSYPRDDFADEYQQVEIMGPPDIAELASYQPCEVGDEMIYAYVPVSVVCDLIEAHGGIVVSELSGERP